MKFQQDDFTLENEARFLHWTRASGANYHQKLSLYNAKIEKGIKNCKKHEYLKKISILSIIYVESNFLVHVLACDFLLKCNKYLFF